MARSRNPVLTKGVRRYSRGAAYKRSGRWAVKNRSTAQEVAKKVVEGKTKKFGKGTRVVLEKAPRFYPTEDSPKRLYSRKNNRNPPRIRASLTPGKVVIILAGRFRGKRCILLKVLPSGLALVTGPYKINGVPLRRVNPAYLIATQTSVDMSGVKVDEKFNDEYFRRPAAKKEKKSADGFFEEKKEEEKKEIDASRKEDQKNVDKQVLAAVKAEANLREYLNAKFSLSKHQYPHNMVF